MSPLQNLLPLGDPGLRRASDAVDDVRDAGFRAELARLRATLDAFREAHGFGRAISAPQIGVPRRFIAVRLGPGSPFAAPGGGGAPDVLVNPEIVWRSDETITMWDDCMSFPGLLVRLRRNSSIAVRYTDEAGAARETPRLDLATSELLQHEIDHLDGVLALDRALDRESIVSREAFERAPAHFRAQVDYVIAPRPRSAAAG
ncbi:MAG: peptide deformylase [Polyangiaceae bacterium]|nr:peptide deformylase [Polyangiaceae bacterium]